MSIKAPSFQPGGGVVSESESATFHPIVENLTPTSPLEKEPSNGGSDGINEGGHISGEEIKGTTI